MLKESGTRTRESGSAARFRQLEAKRSHKRELVVNPFIHGLRLLKKEADLKLRGHKRELVVNP